MLNRRHLRVKVFQAIYAYINGEKQDLGAAERELFNSVNRIYELYIFNLSVLVELRAFALRQIEERKQKRLPTPEDLNPNLKFVDNKLLVQLADNKSMLSLCEKNAVNWTDNQELIKKLLLSIQSSEAYNLYMESDEDSYENDKALVVKIFKNFLADNDLLQHLYEERSIHWSDDHYFVCGYVVKSLKSFEEKFTEDHKLPALFKDLEDDHEFIKVLFRKTLMHSEEYEEMIMAKAKNWEADRIAVVDFILMKMAICELMHLPSVPIKVTLNEYIELSKGYSTPKSRLFINGVLDKIVPELKREDKIQKTGRGLMN